MIEDEGHPMLELIFYRKKLGHKIFSLSSGNDTKFLFFCSTKFRLNLTKNQSFQNRRNDKSWPFSHLARTETQYKWAWSILYEDYEYWRLWVGLTISKQAELSLSLRFLETWLVLLYQAKCYIGQVAPNQACISSWSKLTEDNVFRI